MSQRLIRLTEALTRHSFDVDHTSLADAFWLARFLPARDLPPISPTPIPPPLVGNQRGALPPGTTQPPPTPPPTDTKAAAAQPEASAEASLYAAGEAAPGNVPASPVSVAAGSALPAPLLLARALRPFARRRDSRNILILDEEATAELTAAQRSPTFVLRPAKERWFDLALVIEDTPSMAVWTETLGEFQRVLERHGAFRDVRRWRLRHAPSLHLVSDANTAHPPAALYHASADRLILVVTQGASSLWRGPALTQAFLDWGRNASLAVLQLLPERLWHNTVLGEPDAAVWTRLAGVPNSKYIVHRPGWFDSILGPNVAVPVVTLEPESLSDWARTVMARGGASAPAYTFAAELAAEPPPAAAEPARLSAEDRLARFRGFASPEAIELATLLSAAPLVLPVMRLAQSAVFGDRARQTHLAEFLLGGLVRRVTPESENVPPDQVWYEFHDGVREALQRYLPREAGVNVLRALGRFIERHPDQVGRFSALVPDPQGREALAPWARPFAGLDRRVLERLGVAPPAEPRPAAVTAVPIDPAPPELQRTILLLAPTGVEFADWLLQGLQARSHRVFRFDDPQANLDEAAGVIFVTGDFKTDPVDQWRESAKNAGAGWLQIAAFPRTAVTLLRLCQHIEQTFHDPAPLHDVPELPPDYLERAFTEQAASMLLHDRSLRLTGPDGAGRSIFAAALARHPRVRRAFPGGIWWGDKPGLAPGEACFLPEEELFVTRREGRDEYFHVLHPDRREIELYFERNAAPGFAMALAGRDDLHLNRWSSLRRLAAFSHLCDAQTALPIITGHPAFFPESTYRMLTDEPREFIRCLVVARAEWIPSLVWEHIGMGVELPSFMDKLLVSGLCELDENERMRLNPELRAELATMTYFSSDIARILAPYEEQIEYRAWHTGPNDGFFLENLIALLWAAGRQDEARAVVHSFPWIARRFQVSGRDGLRADFSITVRGAGAVWDIIDRLPPGIDVRELANALAEAEGDYPLLRRVRDDAREWLEANIPQRFIFLSGPATLEHLDLAVAIARRVASAGHGLVTDGQSPAVQRAALAFAAERRARGLDVDVALIHIVPERMSFIGLEGTILRLVATRVADAIAQRCQTAICLPSAPPAPSGVLSVHPPLDRDPETAASQVVSGVEADVNLADLEAKARALNDQGDHAGTSRLLEQVLEGHRGVHGPDHPETLRAKHNLAEALRAQGDLRRAGDLYQQVLDARLRTLGEDHPDTLASIDNLAATLTSPAELPGLRRLHEQALDIRRRMLGDDHPDTLRALDNLAQTLRALGDRDNASRLLEEALGIRSRTLGDRHLDTRRTEEHLEQLHSEMREAVQSTAPRRPPLSITRFAQPLLAARSTAELLDRLPQFREQVIEIGGGVAELLTSDVLEFRLAGYVLFQHRDRPEHVPLLTYAARHEIAAVREGRHAAGAYLLAQCVQMLSGRPEFLEVVDEDLLEALASLEDLLRDRGQLTMVSLAFQELRAGRARLLPNALASLYNRTRAAMPPGLERREELLRIARHMRDSVAPAGAIPALLGGEDAGLRLFAYTQAQEHPDPEMFEPILESLEKHERTGFGQHWGLLALRETAAVLTPEARTVALIERVDDLRHLMTSVQRRGMVDEVVSLLRDYGDEDDPLSEAPA